MQKRTRHMQVCIGLKICKIILKKNFWHYFFLRNNRWWKITLLCKTFPPLKKLKFWSCVYIQTHIFQPEELSLSSLVTDARSTQSWHSKLIQYFYSGDQLFQFAVWSRIFLFCYSPVALQHVAHFYEQESSEQCGCIKKHLTISKSLAACALLSKCLWQNY
jgi:hypothetical protein